MRDYRIDFVNKSIVLSKRFALASQEYGSSEYNTICAIMAENPNFRVVIRESNSGSHRSAYKGLTYAFMRRFILTLDKVNLETFNEVMDYYDRMYTNNPSTVYFYVRNWFLNQYPNYKDLIVASTPANNIVATIEAA